jgi:putative sigma-54 modulation protein
MNIVITGRHFEVTDPIKVHTNEKISKLDKFLTKLLEAHVILSVEKFRHIAEITVIGKNLKVTSTETTSDMYASIDKAVASLEEQLRKHHDKLRSHNAKESRKIKDIALKSISAIRGYFKGERETAAPRIVETKGVAEKPMSVEEAVEEMDISRGEFIVFRNSEDNRINVIYKRKDGGFGLIKT